jgi:hypothetical protein
MVVHSSARNIVKSDLSSAPRLAVRLCLICRASSPRVPHRRGCHVQSRLRRSLALHRSSCGLVGRGLQRTIVAPFPQCLGWVGVEVGLWVRRHQLLCGGVRAGTSNSPLGLVTSPCIRAGEKHHLLGSAVTIRCGECGWWQAKLELQGTRHPQTGRRSTGWGCGQHVQDCDGVALSCQSGSQISVV